jgi:hypothetical protein
MAKGGRWSDGSGVEVRDMRDAETTLAITDHWRAVCFESCTHGSAGGGWKRTQPVSCQATA